MIYTTSSKQAGFTLVEMAIVLAIVGLLIGGALSLYQPINQANQEQETRQKMEKISRAIGGYAAKHYRIPCPGEPDAPAGGGGGRAPFGFELGSGNNGEDLGACDASNDERNGIVPFATLGLSQDDVIDGFGNYFTYKVSPAVADVNNGGAVPTQVHAMCRGIEWVPNSVPPPGTEPNQNPDKAFFCCPSDQIYDENTDIVIQRTGAVDVAPIRLNGAYAAFDTQDITPANNGNLLAAYALISHGQNRFGHYLVNGTRNQYGIAPPGPDLSNIAGNFEEDNADTTQFEVLVSDRITADTNNHYDDIVLWRTQDGILADGGARSCATP